MGSLLNSFKVTKLDLENPSPGSKFQILDTITNYGPLTTGTPTTKANPGKTVNFFQKYIPTKTYLNTVSIGSDGILINTTANSNLDVEDTTPDGGIPYKQDRDPTRYPATNTGTPTTKANPGAPSLFYQTFSPSNQYLAFVKTLTGKSNLIKRNIFDSTNLDIEKPKVNGGIPYKQDKDPTNYPKYVTGTPTTKANPGPFNKFIQNYDPDYVYLDEIEDTSRLEDTLANTNLDVEDSRPNGGIPYKQDKDPTIYPKYVTGTPTTFANPGPFSKFNQVYSPKKAYLDVNPIKGEGKLKSTTANTSLDVETSNPSGFKKYDNVTNFSPNNTGTPTNTSNPGAPTRFTQQFFPKETYLQYVKTLFYRSKFLNQGSTFIDGQGIEKYTIFDATNLDIEKPKVDGGIPYNKLKDPTVYPATTQKKSSAAGFFPIQGQGAAKYDQVFSPKKTYLDFIKKYT